MKALLEIVDLHANVEGKEILRGVNLKVPRGETHVLLGPNGVGKSTLISAILGDAHVKVTKGKIIFKGKDLNSLPMYERVKLGIGVMFQAPPKVTGVTLHDIACICKTGKVECELNDEVKEVSDKLNLESFLARDVNAGFSGGERKRSELLQLMMLAPDFCLIDEPDSGVDVENLKLIGGTLDGFLKNRGALVVTHMGTIFDYMNASWAHVMLNGKIACTKNPKVLMRHIMKNGFDSCVECAPNE